jgi:hypothetical protein
MARKLRPDEREAQNRQLPATVKRNLGGKTLATARADLARTPLGSPPVDYDVRSVYDVRPVAAFDFNVISSQSSSGPGSQLFVEMIVPDGLVAVFRAADMWFEPIPPSIGALRSNYVYSLALNRSDYPNNFGFMGIAIDDEKFFMLADEGNSIGFNFYGLFNSTTAYVRFRGTFQLKSEVPLPFEIANPTHRATLKPRPGVAPVRVSPPPPTPPPPTTAAPTAPPLMPTSDTRSVPSSAARSAPPFEVRWSRILVRGVSTWVAAKPKGGGFVLLKPQELDLYAEFLAQLPKPR